MPRTLTAPQLPAPAISSDDAGRFKGMSQAKIAKLKAAESHSKQAATSIAQAQASGANSEPFCRAAIEAFHAEHNAWINSRFRQDIDREFSAAFDALFAAFLDGDTGQPRGWGGVFDAVAALRVAWEAYCDSTLKCRPLPLDTLWVKIEAVYHALHLVTPKEQHPIEPIKVLWEEGVSLEQIGRMHGLVDKHGNGLVHVVRRLIDEPETDLATIDVNAPKTAVDYWREGLGEGHARLVLPELSPDEITRLWAEFEERYGPQKYMDAEERRLYDADNAYRERERKLVADRCADLPR